MEVLCRAQRPAQGVELPRDAQHRLGRCQLSPRQLYGFASGFCTDPSPAKTSLPTAGRMAQVLTGQCALSSLWLKPQVCCKSENWGPDHF